MYLEDIKVTTGADSYMRMERTAEDRGEWVHRQGHERMNGLSAGLKFIEAAM